MAVTPIGVYIVSYRRPDLLAECLRGVHRHLGGLPVQVWDNHSTDSDKIAELARSHPDVQWHFSPTNVGFASAVNALAASFGAGDLLLLNPDAELAGPLTAMRSAMAGRDDLAAVAPLTSRGSIASNRHQDWDVAHREPSLIRAVVANAGYAGVLRRTPLSDLYPSAPQEVTGYLTGSCLLISRRAWDEVGPFDEDFFLYGEEADWQRRARSAGWKLLLTEEPDVTHLGHGSVADDPLAAQRSRDLLLNAEALRLAKLGKRRRADAFLAAATALGKVQRAKRAQRADEHVARAALFDRDKPAVILTTNTLDYGGAERQRVLLAGELADRGYDVALACLQAFGPLVREVSPAVRLHRLPFWMPTLDLPAGPAVLISGTTNTEVAFAAAWRRLGRGRRWLVAAHNPPRYDGPTYSAALAAVMARSDGIVALSPRHWQELTASQRLHGRHFVVPNGVEIAERPRPASDRAGQPVRLVFVGRLLEEKNPHLLVAALDGLKDLPWTLDICGDGPDLQRLRAQTPAALLDRVRWRGWVAGPDESLADADLMCLPSRAEAFPLVVLEAMARGVPVVASAVCAVGDILDDGAAGLLVDPISIEGWRAALRTAITDPRLRSELGRAGWQRAAEHYSVAKMADGYEQTIATVLTESRWAPA